MLDNPRMQTLKAALTILLLSIPAARAHAEAAFNKSNAFPPQSGLKKVVAKPKRTSDKGWGFLKAKLLKDGISQWEIDAVYESKKMPEMGTVYFSLNPKESHSMYAGFYNEKLIEKARKFLRENKQIFTSAEKRYSVTRNVIAAILLVETKFGEHTGDNLIINRLSRVGGIAKPSNIMAVYKKLKKEDLSVSYKEVEARALHLEERFYPEIIAIFNMARKHKINILELRGSAAGAFGMPQFLPSTFMKYAVDGNSDEKISLFNIADAIHSTANYLSASGWRDNAERAKKEEVIWQYNHSQAYIDTVLAISTILAEG